MTSVSSRWLIGLNKYALLMSLTMHVSPKAYIASITFDPVFDPVIYLTRKGSHAHLIIFNSSMDRPNNAVQLIPQQMPRRATQPL